jgi:predicted kinase
VFLTVITGPIASGKSTLALAVARELEAAGVRTAVIDLDLVYEMLDPGRAAKDDQAKWSHARRLAARLTDALLAEDTAVVVEGDFLTTTERLEFVAALTSPVHPRFVTLRVSFDIALQRARADPTRGLSQDPTFLREHYETTATAIRQAPSTDLTLDTGMTGISEAAAAVATWASSVYEGDSARSSAARSVGPP